MWINFLILCQANMKSHSIILTSSFFSISFIQTFLFQEFVLNARGMSLFTCQWRPSTIEPKALIFLCHGNLITDMMLPFSFQYNFIEVKLSFLTLFNLIISFTLQILGYAMECSISMRGKYHNDVTLMQTLT
jgi:hypothetical protein